MSALGSARRSTSPLEGGNISALVADVVDNVAVFLADGAAIVDGGAHVLTVDLLAILEGGSALNFGGQLASADRRRRRRRGRARRGRRGWVGRRG